MQKIKPVRVLRCAAILMLITAVATLFTGCHNFAEIEDLMIIAGAAIDYDPAQATYTVTAELMSLEKSNGVDTNFQPAYLEGKGKSISQAIDNMHRLCGRSLYWGHAEVFVISKTTAMNSILPVLDWFMRDVNARLSTLVLMADTEKASELFELKSPVSKSVCQALSKIFKDYADVSHHAAVNVSQLVNGVAQPGAAVAVPIIGADQSGEQLAVHGMAVMQKDQLSGEYSLDEMHLLTLLYGETDDEVFPVEVPQFGATVSVRVRDMEVKLHPVLTQTSVHTAIDLALTVGITGVTGGTEEMFSRDGLDVVAQEVETWIAGACSGVIEKDVTVFHADILEVGQLLKHRQTKLWKSVEDNWPEIYKNMTFTLQADVEIDRSGGTIKPIGEGQ